METIVKPEPPQDGTVVELLIEGEWIRAYWDSRADDMSPYGCAGFADEDNGMLIIDFDDWRATEDFYDADAERLADALRHEEYRRLDEADRKRRENKERREQTERRREYLIERYTTLYGEQPTDTRIAPLRRAVAAQERIRSFAEIGNIMKGFGF